MRWRHLAVRVCLESGELAVERRKAQSRIGSRSVSGSMLASPPVGRYRCTGRASKSVQQAPEGDIGRKRRWEIGVCLVGRSYVIASVGATIQTVDREDLNSSSFAANSKGRSRNGSR